MNKEWLATRGLLPGEVFTSLQPVFTRDMWAASVVTDGESESIVLGSRQAKEYDVWALEHIGYSIGNRFYKLGEVAGIDKGQAPQEVAKENQQYRLVLQYEYIGSLLLGDKVLDRELKEFNEQLPMGYSARRESSYQGWGKQDNNQYFLIGLLVAIIFVTTSILFNSLKQPFAVIFIIPVSFIGIFLTIISTILGFTPFMIGTQKEGFWFPLATGTIGGLIMSVIGIWILLPLLLIHHKSPSG